MYNKKFTKEPTEKQKIGAIGEDCACVYLKKQGFTIKERNYLKKWGEIDIVAAKGKDLYFFEVKSVTQETIGQKDGYRPEENIHYAKVARLKRTVMSYILDKNVSDETNWTFNVVTVYINMSKRLSKVHVLYDVIL